MIAKITYLFLKNFSNLLISLVVKLNNHIFNFILFPKNGQKIDFIIKYYIIKRLSLDK